jgi:hypothetical protein
VNEGITCEEVYPPPPNADVVFSNVVHAYYAHVPL